MAGKLVAVELWSTAETVLVVAQGLRDAGVVLSDEDVPDTCTITGI